MPFFVTKLRQKLLRRELTAAALKDPDVGDDIDDFAFQKLKKQAKQEVHSTLTRLMYRSRYNLPPNDPRFLDLTDEDIIYELILQSEYAKWDENRLDEEEADDSRVIYRNTDEFDDIVKKLENGEDVDLDSLMIPDETWEKVDGD